MKEITLLATDDNLNAVNALVEGELEAIECPPRAAMQLMVALEELYVNVAHYAYGEGCGDITVQVDVQPGEAIIRLIDKGIAFDPLAKADPDTTLSAEDRPIGGLGVFMVKKRMDVFNYERVDGKNIVTIAKKW